MLNTTATLSHHRVINYSLLHGQHKTIPVQLKCSLWLTNLFFCSDNNNTFQLQLGQKFWHVTHTDPITDLVTRPNSVVERSEETFLEHLTGSIWSNTLTLDLTKSLWPSDPVYNSDVLRGYHRHVTCNSCHVTHLTTVPTHNDTVPACATTDTVSSDMTASTGSNTVRRWHCVISGKVTQCRQLQSQ